MRANLRVACARFARESRSEGLTLARPGFRVRADTRPLGARRGSGRCRARFPAIVRRPTALDPPGGSSAIAREEAGVR